MGIGYGYHMYITCMVYTYCKYCTTELFKKEGRVLSSEWQGETPKSKTEGGPPV